MRIGLSAGHTLTGKGTGAIGYINESKENREMFKLVKKYLEQLGHTVYDCTVDSGSDYLERQVALANKYKCDVVVQIHFNAFNTTDKEMGTETLYCEGSKEGKVYADKVHNKLKTLFIDRKVKSDIETGRKLYWLRNTNAPSILIEVCFVDSKADTNKYNSNKNKIAKLITEGLTGQVISENPTNNKPNESYQIGTYKKDVVVTPNIGVNVRSGRGTNFAILNKFTQNKVVNIWYIDKDSKGELWGSCSSEKKDTEGKNITGYIHMDYVKPKQ